MRSLRARFPRLASTLSSVDLRVEETPVERWCVDGVSLLAKRDDLSASALGGNKVRALELLLQTPEIGPIAHHDLRRLLLRRFPYAVYYRINVPVIEVRACLHHRQHQPSRLRAPEP